MIFKSQDLVEYVSIWYFGRSQVLIRNLINKLGDPVHKVASRVVYGIEKVAQKYSKMKEDILNEIERMLFRWVVNVISTIHKSIRMFR